MGYRSPNHKPGTFYKREYRYDAYRDKYACPLGRALPYSTTNRVDYREYKSNPQRCLRYEVRDQYTSRANAIKGWCATSGNEPRSVCTLDG